MEHYEGQDFETWRRFSKRFKPSAGQFGLDMMSALVNPAAEPVSLHCYEQLTG